MSLLEVRNLTKLYGGLAANHEISLDIEEGELVGIIGPNGAGKTTLFNQVSGLVHPDSGTVRLAGQDITGARPDRVCRAGLARTFQVVRVFLQLTVLQNVVVGALLRHGHMADAERRAWEVLERVGLAERAHMRADELTLAGRKRLELARALATEPRLLLLDEVMSGLTPREAEAAVQLLNDLRQDITIVIIEHVMEIIMPLSDRVIVLVEGEKLVEGAPADISTDERVISAYLGEKFVAGGR